MVNDAAEFALWLSPHILANTGRVLATMLKTPDDEVDELESRPGRRASAKSRERGRVGGRDC